MLEGYAIRRAASFATIKQISELRDLATQLSKLVPPATASDYKAATIPQ